MIPLASATGIGIVSVAVLSALVLMRWLLRLEAREDAAEKAAEHARSDGPGLP